jgi:hypothetical protein
LSRIGAAAWAQVALALVFVAEAGAGHRQSAETERAIVEFDPSEMSPSEAESFARLADQGIDDIERLVGADLPPRGRRTRRIRFIVDARFDVSRTYGATILLPLERVRSRSAPYLHETAHALLPSRSDAVWLSEGLASYLESWVSENRGGYDAHVFTRAGNEGIHAAARRWLATETGRAVLPWVGGRGQPPGLEEERERVARPFYVLSQSLTKYLVDTEGLDAVVRLMVSGDAFASATGRSREQWRSDWLSALGVSVGPASS